MICLQSVKYNSCQCLPDSYEEQRYLLHSYDITVGGKRNAVMLKSNNCCVSLGHSGFVFELEETSLLFIFFLQKKKVHHRDQKSVSAIGESLLILFVSCLRLKHSTQQWFEAGSAFGPLFFGSKTQHSSQLESLNIFLLICITVGSSAGITFISVHPDQPIKIFYEIKFQQSVMTSVGIWAVS